MGQIRNKWNYGRPIPNDADNYVKCKGLTSSIKGWDCDTG